MSCCIYEYQVFSPSVAFTYITFVHVDVFEYVSLSLVKPIITMGSISKLITCPKRAVIV